MNPIIFINKIIGNYRIMKKIGEGAYSYVFLAIEIESKSDESKNNNVKKKVKSNEKHYAACKIIPRIKVNEKKTSKRLDQEIRIHQLMHHQNVVQLIDVQKDNQFYYIFLEYCPCGELFNLVVKNGKLNEEDAAIFFKQLLIGLDYIHSLNAIHRDLKPENILVDRSGLIKISDFGLSKLLTNQSNGYTKTPCGSPCYASPELISGKPYDGKKSDIWSCGVILYAITTGFLPWSKKDKIKLLEQIRKGDYAVPSEVSDTCANLISRLMTVDTTKRITIKEALNHPFLKEIIVPTTNFDMKFVSLRKIDRFLDSDDDFEYEKEIDHLCYPKIICNSNIEMTFIRVRKEIENDDSKKRLNRLRPNQELIRTDKSSEYFNNCIIYDEKRINNEIKNNNNQQLLVKVSPRKNKIIPCI